MKKLFAVCVTAVLGLCFALAACGGDKIADNTEHFDDITKTLKLSNTYDGKTLFKEGGGGIEEAVAPIPGETTDGDTTYFGLKTSGDSVTVRYQGVDTPESTAGVEKWGKAASVFTNERLHAATTIVIESAKKGNPPDKDSTGSGRYLCYVWYKTAEDKDLKLLNLELVENGYSLNKESASSSYYSYFQKAEEFARSIKLRLFSDLDDPLYDTHPKDFSLRDFSEHPENFAENSKVRLMAYVTEKRTSSTGSVTFKIAQYDEETNKVYEMTLFAGYTTATSAMRIGNLYHIVGTLQKYDGNWQISGVTLNNTAKGNEDETWTAQIGYCLSFNSNNLNSPNGYGDVTVTSVNLSGTTLTFEGTAPIPDEDGETESFTFTVTVSEGYDSIKVGSRLTISACYQFEAASGKLTVTDVNKISIK